MQQITFSPDNGAFARDIRQGLSEYFHSGKNRHADQSMVIKSLTMLTLYLVPLIILCSGTVSAVSQVFLLYLICGLGMAGIGMNIMHDALHGSYAKNSVINKIMSYSINLIGANASVWHIQHNVLHHTYTNIAGADDDLNTNMLLRFSPDKPWHWIHRYQFIYAWLLYGMMTLQWVTIRDFVRMRQYKEMGFYEGPGAYTTEVVTTLAWKVVYFIVSLVLPLLMIAQPWWIVVLAFLSMHFVTGSIISIVFETAHITPSAEYPKPDDQGALEDHWFIHQLVTTCNFAPKNRALSWCIGGLNYQIEHHLMPHVCHVHYRGLSAMVQAVAKKHGLPYHTHSSFLGAISAHAKKLWNLGREVKTQYATSPESKGLGALIKS